MIWRSYRYLDLVDLLYISYCPYSDLEVHYSYSLVHTLLRENRGDHSTIPWLASVGSIISLSSSIHGLPFRLSPWLTTWLVAWRTSPHCSLCIGWASLFIVSRLWVGDKTYLWWVGVPCEFPLVTKVVLAKPETFSAAMNTKSGKMKCYILYMKEMPNENGQ